MGGEGIPFVIMTAARFKSRLFRCGGFVSLALLLALLLGTVPALAAEGGSSGKEEGDKGEFVHQLIMKTRTGVWKISAQTLVYDHEASRYEADGNVVVTSADKKIVADHAVLDQKNALLDLKGHVLLQYSQNWLRGERVQWNLDSETGTVDEGMVFFSENHLYAVGKNIAKIGAMQYTFDKGYLTSCDPDKPDWKLRFNHLDVTMEGLGWATDSSFWVRDLPVAYSPVVAMPVEEKRQSGLLLPWIGFSDLNGFEVEVPYYWAIRQDMDATFFVRQMEDRGTMGGIEYRYAHPKWGEGILQFNYLQDQASRSHLSEQGFPYQREDRYWVRSRQTFDLWDNTIKGKLDIDYVSDRNFLLEFGKGSSSYSYSNTMFKEFFGRGILDDKTSLARESTLYLERPWESSLLSMDVRFWDQLDRSRDEYTLQRLPALSYRVIPSWVDKTPLYWDFESSYVNYWRREGTTGDRLDLYPRLHYPLHWGSYLDVEASAGGRTTSYLVDWEDEKHGSAQERLLGDFRIEASSRLNRVYTYNYGNFTAFQHSIRPEIAYTYLPDEQRDWIPTFDSLDDDQSRNRLDFGFSNFLIGKQLLKDAEGNEITRYRELARLRVVQPLNFEKPPDDEEFLPGFDPQKGFAPVDMRLDLYPKERITLTYDTNPYTYNGYPSHHNLLLTYDSLKGHIFRIDYAHEKDLQANEINTQVLFKLTSNLYAITYHDFSFDQGEMFKQGYGFRFVQGCWSLGIVYEREQEDSRVSVSVNLLGIGTFGKKLPYERETSLLDSVQSNTW